MIADAIAILNELKAHYDEWGVRNALFDWQGNRIEGDDDLRVEVTRDATRDDCWFYHVHGPKGYEFVHMPVVAGVYPDYGHPAGSKNADARFFRYVPTPLSSAMGGNPNVKVNFVVFGYPPKALLRTHPGIK